MTLTTDQIEAKTNNVFAYANVLRDHIHLAANADCETTKIMYLNMAEQTRIRFNLAFDVLLKGTTEKDAAIVRDDNIGAYKVTDSVELLREAFRIGKDLDQKLASAIGESDPVKQQAILKQLEFKKHMYDRCVHFIKDAA
jgi:hypothetical protein